MIIKNGKRIDGFSTDSLPIGTLQPYLGLKAPNGYLICDGSLISKTIYAELYAVCGSLFGTETATRFYLPDLRGKTIAGYNSGDATLNTIGKLLGSTSHTHTTGNHTLTVEEMPSHTHGMTLPSSWMNGYYHGETRWGFNADDSTSNPNRILATGGGQAHNHGNTSSTSNYQPTFVANWIVKAKNLVAVTAVVEDSLTSSNNKSALSAAQGKILNDTKMVNNIPVCIGSQILYGEISGSGPKGKTALIGAYGTSTFDGITGNVSVPTGYHIEYRVTCQCTTGSSNTVNLYFNNFKLVECGTWSGTTYRRIAASPFFKSSDIAQEPTYGYSQNGINLYYESVDDGTHSYSVWNITIHAYIVKD